MHWEDSGAFTGEVSPQMLAELCHYVIIGHSERRTYFGETDETVNKKVRAALNAGLIPIVCVGETLQENEAGQTQAVVNRQLSLGLAGIEFSAHAQGLVIAYEPVWAIGTGKAATSTIANSVIGDICRGALARVFSPGAAQSIRILYGGSVKASNAEEYFQQPDIDGALVGGASLKVEEFIPIVRAAGL
jgi:triosephosphate isomerase